MALQKSGVQLVAENEAGFLGALGRSQKAVSSFEGTVTKSAGGFGIAQAAAAGFAGFLGGAVLGALSSAARGFANLGKSAFSVVADYERLSMSLSALTAKEVLNAGAAANMGEAMEVAAPLARELLNWVEELAIKSPFDQEGVAAALRTAVAYGFLTTAASSVEDAQAKGIVTAQRLTQALIDWASGAGFTSFAMERVSLALGQMQAKGKVSGQELRQLTEAGLGTNAILTEMGYTLQDVENGLVSADEFILQFAKTMESDFGGAAERSAGTLSGLANSISDLGKKYLREFFGPVDQATGKIGGILGVVQPLLQKFVDTLMDERVLNAVRMLGTLLGDVLTGGMSKAGAAMSGFMNVIGGPIIQTAQNAFAWGQNIVNQLASGIIQAASTILVGAINFVSSILSHWFSPGSPPLVAPEIDKWGEGTLDAWLHGFTDADFGILKSIQSPLQSALNTLVQGGSLDKDAAGMAFAGISTDLIEAMSSGTGLDEVLARITEEAGQFGPELADLAIKQFNLAAGVKAVEQAENDLANARKAEEEAGLKVNMMTQEYNDLLRSGASGDILKDKMDEINLAKDEQEAAKASATEAENRLEAAKETLAVLEEQAKLQKELLDQLIAIAQAQIPQPVPITPEPPEPAGGAGGSTAGGGLPAFDPIDIQDKFNDMLDNIVQSIKDKFATAFQPVVDAWNKAVAAIQAAWDKFVSALTASGLIAQFLSIWQSLQTLAEIGIGILWQFISTGLETIGRLWNEHKNKVFQIWGQLWTLISSIVGGVLGLIVSNIDQRLQEAVTFFETNSTTITSIIEGFWKNYETVADLALTNVLGYVSDRLTTMQTLWDEFGPRTLNAIDSAWDTIAEIFWHGMGEALKAVDSVLKIIATFWEEHGASVQIIVSAFLGFVGGFFDNMMTGVAAIVTFVFEFIAAFLRNNAETIKMIISGAWTAIKGYFQAAVDIIGGIVDFLAGMLTGDFELMKSGLSQIWQGLWDGIGVALIAAWTFIKIIAAAGWAFLVTTLTGLVAILVGLWTGLWNTVTGAIESARAFIVEKLAALQASWSEVWGSIQAKATEVWNGILEFINTQITALQGFILTTTTAIKTAWDTFWNNVKLKADGIILAIKTFIETTLQNLFTSMGLDLDTMRARWSQIWTDVKEIANEIWDRIYEKISTTIAIAKQWVVDRITELQETWTEIWDSISSKATEIWDTIYETVSTKVSAAKQWVLDRVGELKTWWATTWGEISGKITEIWDGIFLKVSGKTDEAKGYIETQFGLFKTWWITLWDDIKEKVSLTWDGILAKAKIKVQEIYDAVTSKIDEILTAIGTKVGEFQTMGANLIEGMKEGVLGAVGDLIDAVTKAIEDAIAAAKGALGLDSPSKVFMEIGYNVNAGFAKGIDQSADKPANALTDTINAMISPLAASSPSYVTNSNTMNLTMQNSVGNNMDVRMLENLIITTVRKAFQT